MNFLVSVWREKKILRKFVIWLIIFLLFVLIFLYKKNSFQIYDSDYFQDKYSNYLNSDKIVEYLKNCDSVGCSVLPHQSFWADIIWLRSVQHAGQTDFFSYDENLYYELESITNISPYWQYPYIFTQYLLPLQKHSFLKNEEISSVIEKKSWEQAVLIGEKGVDFLCDSDLQKCYDFEFPKSLAFTYFYYLGDLVEAKKYYQLAADSDDAPYFLQNMAAVIEGRIGNHLKSAIMWYEKFLSEQENGGEKSEYFIKKSVFEYTLHLIEITDANQNFCVQDLECLQKEMLLQKTIINAKKLCVDSVDTISEISCMLLKYGLDNGFIGLDGSLEYPLDENLYYGYREDVSDWRVWEVE